MEEIRAFFGEKARIISEFDRHPPAVAKKIHEEILKILKRRAPSLTDLSQGIEIIRENEIESISSRWFPKEECMPG